jgi:hypothetical protein
MWTVTQSRSVNAGERGRAECKRRAQLGRAVLCTPLWVQRTTASGCSVAAVSDRRSKIVGRLCQTPSLAFRRNALQENGRREAPGEG